MIVSSFARAHTWEMISSDCVNRISKILKVARVISYCLTSGSSSILGKPFRPNSSHFFSRKNKDGPVYSFNKKAFDFNILIISSNSFLFLTPVCGKITYPLKLQYWHPIWNSLEFIYTTSMSGFFLRTNSIVFVSSLADGMVADAKMINFGG